MTEQKTEPASRVKRPVYSITVRGEIPDDLAEKISSAHAKALLQGETSATNTSEVEDDLTDPMAAD